MIGVFFALVVLVAIVMSVFHVSAGVAWVIVIAAVVALVAYQAKYGTTRRRTKTGVLFSSICPECRKHVKPRATRCNHCGAALVEQIARPTPEVDEVTPRSTRFCPGCGTKVLSASAAHCERCGTALVVPQRL